MSRWQFENCTRAQDYRVLNSEPAKLRTVVPFFETPQYEISRARAAGQRSRLRKGRPDAPKLTGIRAEVHSAKE